MTRTMRFVPHRILPNYVNADGDISNYYPDFLVKLTDGCIVVVETKGQEDLDVPQKMRRLRQWIADVNQIKGTQRAYDFVYMNQEDYEKYNLTSFMSLLEGFCE